uniref:G-protein coupled receptors family 1 profile domain-containing protein n=1 Tax=Scophthalmus maximus TaxID=52904 RepID=A0A8D3DDP7_SCOMX
FVWLSVSLDEQGLGASAQQVALGVILLFTVSLSPYSVVALTATAGSAHQLTPNRNSIPAIISKASAIFNPIIYAITHPKLCATIGRCVPLLREEEKLLVDSDRPSFSGVLCTGP